MSKPIEVPSWIETVEALAEWMMEHLPTLSGVDRERLQCEISLAERVRDVAQSHGLAVPHWVFSQHKPRKAKDDERGALL